MIKYLPAGMLSFALLFHSPTISAQPIDSTQLRIANRFLSCISKGLVDSCWQMFDNQNNPGVTKEQFVGIMTQFKENMANFDGYELVMNGINVTADKQFNVYSFKPITKRNFVDDILIDVLFENSSTLVAGIRPKKRIKENSASTSAGKETQLEGRFSATIDSVHYNITGINIVHFSNDEGLLAIQVEFMLPKDLKDNDKHIRKESIKLARYLIGNGYLEKARTKAKEIGKKLLDDIGVSFIDPTTGAGFNIMVKPGEYMANP
jgi:hypothetical protein